MNPRKPTIVTDGGPWAEHDMACAVCQTQSAVLDLDVGIFQPCWSCQGKGFAVKLGRRRPTRKAMRKHNIDGNRTQDAP